MRDYYINIKESGSLGTPSGIEYMRIPIPQVTTYNVGDIGWAVQNGRYSWTDNLNPLYIQAMDMTDPDPFYKLKYDNAFGNKYRYTDISGNPAADFKLGFNKSPGNTEYIIDHLTGMGFCTQIITSTVTSWGFLMLEISTRTDFGFDDWFPITKNIVNSSMPASSLVNSTSTTQGSLFYGTASNVPAYWYGETPTNSSSNAFRSTSGNISIGSKAIQGLATYMCRIHYK